VEKGNGQLKMIEKQGTQRMIEADLILLSMDLYIVFTRALQRN